jgi:hypothetical protein
LRDAEDVIRRIAFEEYRLSRTEIDLGRKPPEPEYLGSSEGLSAEQVKEECARHSTPNIDFHNSALEGFCGAVSGSVTLRDAAHENL